MQKVHFVISKVLNLIFNSEQQGKPDIPQKNIYFLFKGLFNYVYTNSNS